MTTRAIHSAASIRPERPTFHAQGDATGTRSAYPDPELDEEEYGAQDGIQDGQRTCRMAYHDTGPDRSRNGWAVKDSHGIATDYRDHQVEPDDEYRTGGWGRVQVTGCRRGQEQYEGSDSAGHRW
jgi:hypothetical protein